MLSLKCNTKKCILDNDNVNDVNFVIMNYEFKKN